MPALLLRLLLAVSCVYVTPGAESRAALEAAGIKRLCTEADLAGREALPAPGITAYPREDAADPSAFAQKIRRQLTDEQRVLRVYGSEVVIGRLTGDATRIRLHLLNYGGREIEGLRIRVRGAYRAGEARVAGAGRFPLEDHVVAEGATEFSVPRITTYAVIDLEAAR